MILLTNVTIKIKDGFAEYTKHLGEESYWIVREDSHDIYPWTVYYVAAYGGEEQVVDWFHLEIEALQKAKWVEENYT